MNGSVPPAFLGVYINDINSDIKFTLRIFADDSILYRQVTSREDQCIIEEEEHEFYLVTQ